MDRAPGAFHYAKDFGNFGGRSNGKVHFGTFRPEYSGSPPGGGPFTPVGIVRPKLPFHFHKPVHRPTSLHLCRELEQGMKNDKSHSSWLARFYRKMSFHFLQVSPLVSDRSVWHNRKHPPSTGILRTPKVTSFQLVELCTGIAEVTGSNPV